MREDPLEEKRLTGEGSDGDVNVNVEIRASKRWRAAQLFLVTSLLGAGLVGWNAGIWSQEETVVVVSLNQTLRVPPPRTSPPTVEAEIDPYEDYAEEEGSWMLHRSGMHSYMEQKGVCFFDNIIRRVNNRPGDPLNCFSACTGLNLHLRDIESDKQCIGWTLVRRKICDSDSPEEEGCSEEEHGSNVCLLHHTLADEGKVLDKRCWSGRLLKKDMQNGGNATQVEDADAEREGDDTYGDDEESVEDRDELYEDNEDYDMTKALNFSKTCPRRVAVMGSEEESMKRPLKVFVVCLQSSGCTLLSYLLAQRDGTTSILDLGVRQQVPRETAFYDRAMRNFPRVDTIVIKISLRGINAQHPRDLMRAAKEGFNPDVSILMVRNPVDSFLHMATHIGKSFNGKLPSDSQLAQCKAIGADKESYGITCGRPEHKLEAQDALYSLKDQFNLQVMSYEAICGNRTRLVERLEAMGICIPLDNVVSPRWSVVDVMRYSFKYFLSERASHGGVFWGVGNLQNTFHDRFGDVVEESLAFRICDRELDVKSNRARLLKHAAKPYSAMKMEEIEIVAQKRAPVLTELYKDNESPFE